MGVIKAQNGPIRKFQNFTHNRCCGSKEDILLKIGYENIFRNVLFSLCDFFLFSIKMKKVILKISHNKEMFRFLGFLIFS